jgi:hypothetical protein
MILRNFFLLFLAVAVLLPQAANAQKKRKAKTKKNKAPELIESLMKTDPGSFSTLLKKQEAFRLQIIYTIINRDSTGLPVFTEYRYGRNPFPYFYPASLVKLPVSLLALEKINALQETGVNSESAMQTLKAGNCQIEALHDSTALDNQASIAHYIKKMMLVSDNDAYSRTFEFLGYENVNKRMHALGYNDARIVHRFDPWCNQKDNLCSNPIRFLDTNGGIIYEQAAQCATVAYKHPMKKVTVGKAYMAGKKKIRKGKNFSSMNHLPLEYADRILKSLVFPNNFPHDQRFSISDQDRKFILNYMSMFPRESNNPSYAFNDFEDSHKKYWIYGNTHDSIQSDSIKIYNIVGLSYGFLSDCAYITDPKNGVEFFLSAAIYVNKDGILNDGKYEYKSVGLPFFEKFGKLIYQFERSRKKVYPADFSSLPD